ncbi:uncharacterized protein DS421_19g647430 [Arachis hypogaea]|uniref:Uncharacterized protein n=1 Tax=Arachis hypogaea TaxID=3818 RepID=A0A6B9V960_ARAHY|nr:uncharacterized protein DS421_19g647430 [Arachis hypogaea]
MESEMEMNSMELEIEIAYNKIMKQQQQGFRAAPVATFSDDDSNLGFSGGFRWRRRRSPAVKVWPEASEAVDLTRMTTATRLGLGGPAATGQTRVSSPCGSSSGDSLVTTKATSTSRSAISTATGQGAATAAVFTPATVTTMVTLLSLLSSLSLSLSSRLRFLRRRDGGNRGLLADAVPPPLSSSSPCPLLFLFSSPPFPSFLVSPFLIFPF